MGALMLWAVEILKLETGKPPVIVKRLAHAAESIEEVKASMRAMLESPSVRYRVSLIASTSGSSAAVWMKRSTEVAKLS